MQIHGFNKTTLLDYPGHLASTVFLGGCNFRCPFCHNASLVLEPANESCISEEEVFNVLKKRKNILEGVCITGGEPTLYSGLFDFIRKIKDLGLLVKLDTNGTNPHILNKLIDDKLIDYVAMDIKNSLEKYPLSTGISGFDGTRIKESICCLLKDTIEYEFRTTVVKEHHNKADFIAMGRLIEGARAYYLQAYKESEDIIMPGLSGYAKAEMEEMKELAAPFVKKVELRGID